MEHNSDSQFNRGRVIYRAKRHAEIVEEESEMAPESLNIKKEPPDTTMRNTNRPGAGTKENETIAK